MTRLFAPFVLVVSLAAASDVLSVVKPNRSGDAGGQLGVPAGDRFGATNVTVAALIAAAYGSGLPLREERVVGLPGWATRERFDVEARHSGPGLPEEPADDQAVFTAFAIVRTVLAERFALRVHEESRPALVYALRHLTPSSIGLQPTTTDCEAIRLAGPFADVRGTEGQPLQPCAVRARRGEMAGTGATMPQLADSLARVSGVDRDVLDMTGLDGRFDFTLRWTPPQPSSAAADGIASVTDSGPSIFTALQEQLGLKLDAIQGRIRVLIVDRVNRPGPN